MNLEDFLAREQAEGQTVTEDAVFTLNPAQVRSRVATFCAQERLYPLWRCLQGALRVARSDLFLRYERGSWVATFSWPEAPSPKCFQGFLLDGLTEGFDAVDQLAGQHLFFGFSAALGGDGYRLEWASPAGGFVARGGQVQLTDSRHPEYCQLAFAVDEGWWQRLTGSAAPRSDAERQLRRRLCYSAVPVHIEGERLMPVVPEPPDRPWASRLAEGSDLAWRYLMAPSGGRLHPPETTLDRYRVGRKGKVWHLVSEVEGQPLPLSIQFAEIAPSRRPSAPRTLPQGDEVLCQTALFLSLQAGRKDWLFPVRDGVLCEPTPLMVASGGVLVLSSDDDLRYDLSGLKVIENSDLEIRRALWAREARSLKAELRVSLANSALRAESMPSQYFQASGYALGGPYAGMLAGKVGPLMHRMLRRKKRPDG